MKLHFNALSLLLGAAIISPVATATTPLWFEVEVVLFERLGEETKEKFVDTIKQFNLENSIKLQDDHLYPPLDLCPTLSQFERFSLSKQAQVDNENNTTETQLTGDTSLIETPIVDTEQTVTEELATNTPDITVIQCKAPNDERLQEAFNILQKRLTQAQVAAENDLTDSVNVIPASPLDSLIQDITIDSASESETFDPNVFVPYPQRFSFNGIEYSSSPRVVINKVPTVIAAVIEPSIATETPAQDSKTESNELEKQHPILIHTPDRPYLLDKSRLEMTELVQKFRWQKTSRPLLHIGWRQPMVTRDLAVPIHLFAGKDYSDEYDDEGNNKALLAAKEQAALLNEEIALKNAVELDDVQNALQDEAQVVTELPSTSITDIVNELNTSNTIVDTKPIWKLDGLLKIYLNRFLFIEPNFDLRKVEQVKVIPEVAALKTDTQSVLDINEQTIEPVNNEPTYVSKLTSHPMSQHRRVRSTEVHYFDHPNMGMVIQIRRFKISEEETAEQK